MTIDPEKNPEPGAPAGAEGPAPASTPAVLGVSELAKRIGINRRTIAKLRARFPGQAPLDTDEQAWRRFLKLAHIRTRAPIVDIAQQLDELVDLADEAEGGDSRPATGTPAVGTGTIGGDLGVESWAQESAKQTALLRSEQAAKAKRERELLDRRVIDREDVARVVGAFAVLVVAELTDLPTVVARSPQLEHIDRADRGRIRRAIAEAIEAARGRVAEAARGELGKLFRHIG